MTYLAIRDLPGPPLGADRAEYSQAERVGEQIVRLIAMLALHLVRAERARLKLFSFDEGWRLLGDPVGRMLLASLQRMGRSERAVPIISTQLVGDALIGERESLENLIGATFVFGVRSQLEAARALALLGLDPEDAEMRRVLLSLEAGRCLFRDHRGRIEAIQVDLVAAFPAEGALDDASSRVEPPQPGRRRRSRRCSSPQPSRRRERMDCERTRLDITAARHRRRSHAEPAASADRARRCSRRRTAPKPVREEASEAIASRKPIRWSSTGSAAQDADRR